MHTYAEPGTYLVKLTASNKEFTDSLKQYVEVEGIKKISNNRGGNDGQVSLDIYGGGLSENTVVKLVKDGTTISTYSVYKKEPGVICATFDLTNESIGVYDIVVTIDGKDYTVTDGFTIEEKIQSQIEVDILGNSSFIAGRPVNFSLDCRNIGNVDASDIILWLEVPIGVELNFKINSSINIQSDAILPFDVMESSFNPSELSKIYGFYITSG